jgi:hypothetical protein
MLRGDGFEPTPAGMTVGDLPDGCEVYPLDPEWAYVGSVGVDGRPIVLAIGGIGGPTVSLRSRLDKLERLFRDRKPANPYANLTMLERAERVVALFERRFSTHPCIVNARRELADLAQVVVLRHAVDGQLQQAGGAGEVAERADGPGQVFP